MKILKSTFFSTCMAVMLIGLPAGIMGAETVTIGSLPQSEDEFVAMRNEIAKTPEGGAALFITAMITFVKNRELGMKFFTIALDQGNLSGGNVYKGFKPGPGIMYHINRLADARRAHLPFAYIEGASPSNGYAASLPYRLIMSRNRYSIMKEDRIKVFIACSGVTMPRPLTMQKNDKGHWKVSEASSLFVDVSAPKKNDGDDL